MDNVKAKESACYSAMVAENNQQEAVNKSRNELALAQNAYLQSVVLAAVAHEKLRRRKDTLIALYGWGAFLVVAAILAIINPLYAAAFAAVVLVVWLVVRSNGKEARIANWNNRWMFFKKYAHIVPANEKLKWRDASLTYSGPTVQ